LVNFDNLIKGVFGLGWRIDSNLINPLTQKQKLVVSYSILSFHPFKNQTHINFALENRFYINLTQNQTYTILIENHI